MKKIGIGTLGREGKDRAIQTGCSLSLDLCERMEDLLEVFPEQRKCIMAGVIVWERI
jgi:hypothetical protein